MTAADITVTGVAQSPAASFSNPRGDVSLGVARWPHVQGSLSIPSAPGLLDTLDPRIGPQRVTLTCTDAIAGTSRTFDLGVRSASAKEDATISVELASDEAILEDHSPAVEHTDILSAGPTAGDVTTVVLSEIGATLNLAGSTGAGASLQPYWQLTNLVVNPRFTSSTKGTATYGGASGQVAGIGWNGKTGLRYATVAGGSRMCIAGFDPATSTMTAIPVTPGTPTGLGFTDKWITVSCFLGSETPNHALGLILRFHQGGGAGAIEAPESPFPITSGWVEHYMTSRIPVAATHVEVVVLATATAASTLIHVDEVTVTESRSTDNVGMFNGGTPDDANYTYSWDGVVDDSTSTRYPVVERDPDALIWKPGQGGMSFLSPLLQSVGLRLVCDEQRVWTLRDDTYTAAGSTTLEAGVNLHAYNIGSSLDDDGFCDAATVVYTWNRFDRVLTREDTYESTPSPRKRIRREIAAPYPGPGRAENIVRRALSRGRRTSGTALTNWPTTTDQPVTVTTPEGTRTGTVGGVTFNLEDDTMTVTVRPEETP